MPFLFQYLVKLSISLAVVYTFYHVVLKPLTFYQWNRFYLVCYSLLSFVIPFINISGWLAVKDMDHSYLVNTIPAVDKLTSRSFHVTSEGNNIMDAVLSWDFAAVFFLSGTLVMFSRIVYQYLSLRAMKKKARLLQTGEFEFYDVNRPITPFSFANAIFINSRLHTEEEFHRILEHEFVHVKQKHTIDIIVAELICVLNWFNPFAWLIRNSIRQNLEFIADKNVLEGGIDPRQYQYLLLKVMGLPQYSITNNFSFSSLKQRIAMMNKISTARIHLVRFLFVLPLISVMLLAFRDKVNFNKDALMFTYAGFVINASDNQPLKNIVIKELNTNKEIATDVNGFFKLRIPYKDDLKKLRINILQNGELKKELSIRWVEHSPLISETFFGLVGMDNTIPVNDQCVNCFTYQDQVRDANGLFVNDISYPDARKTLTGYLQTREDFKLLSKSDLPITRTNNRIYILSGDFTRPDLTSGETQMIVIEESGVLPLIYKNGAVSSIEDVNASTKRHELKQVNKLTKEQAFLKYGKLSEVIDILTHREVGSDTLPELHANVLPIDNIEKRLPISSTVPAEARTGTVPVTILSNVSAVKEITSLQNITYYKNEKTENRTGPSQVNAITAKEPVTFKKVVTGKMPVTIDVPVNEVAVNDTIPRKVVIVGLSQKAANEPMYIVDGIRLPKGSNMNTINPDSIKEINILKGQNALEVYGAEAVNGVVQVVTRAHGMSAVTGTSENSAVTFQQLLGFKGLIIVDGKEVSYETLFAMKGEDIKTITVLKDSSATAIYNEKGKNGVIIIKSKNKE